MNTTAADRVAMWLVRRLFPRTAERLRLEARHATLLECRRLWIEAAVGSLSLSSEQTISVTRPGDESRG